MKSGHTMRLPVRYLGNKGFNVPIKMQSPVRDGSRLLARVISIRIEDEVEPVAVSQLHNLRFPAPGAWARSSLGWVAWPLERRECKADLLGRVVS